MLQRLKALLRDQLGLPPTAVLVFVGCLAYLALNFVLRRPLTSGWGLLGPLVLGIALESFEMCIQYKDIGLFAPDNDHVIAIIGRHGLDFLAMLAGPLMIVALGAISAR